MSVAACGDSAGRAALCLSAKRRCAGMRAGPEHTAEATLLGAEDRLDRRELMSAIEAFDAAERQGANPDRCSAGRWMVFMLRGEFRSAWQESDSIRLRGGPDPHRFWNGEDIRAKRVMIRSLHGFGDAVQFLRYAPALRAMAKEVSFEVAPRFVELAHCFDGVDHVITWGQGSPGVPPEWDVQMEVMELPYFFRTEVPDLPVAQRYLSLPRRFVARVRNEMGNSNKARIGVVWSSGGWNPSRNVPFDRLAPLLESGDCEFWNLQGPQASTPDSVVDGLRETRACRDSILTLATVISELDLVITVDTLAAHLAGALGVPAWVMLQYAADWRWMIGTSGSPWYPSLRLFRQSHPGDWESTVAEVQCALRGWLRGSRARLMAS